MQLFLVFLLGFYLLMAPYFFRHWLKLFRQDSDLSLEEKQLSRLVLVVATVFWPIVVPFAYLELMKKVQKEKQKNCLSTETKMELEQSEIVELPEIEIDLKPSSTTLVRPPSRS